MAKKFKSTETGRPSINKADLFFFGLFPVILTLLVFILGALSKPLGSFFTASFNQPFVLLVWGFAALLWANHRLAQVERDWSSFSATDFAAVLFFIGLTAINIYQVIAKSRYSETQSVLLLILFVAPLTFFLFFGLALWQPFRKSLEDQLIKIIYGKRIRDHLHKFWLFFWSRFSISDIMTIFITYFSYILLVPSSSLATTYTVLAALLLITFILKVKIG